MVLSLFLSTLYKYENSSNRGSRSEGAEINGVGVGSGVGDGVGFVVGWGVFFGVGECDGRGLVVGVGDCEYVFDESTLFDAINLFFNLKTLIVPIENPAKKTKMIILFI